jgi:hypothetical protein
MRTLLTSLGLILMVSPSVSAQEDAATSWPSADELRRDLQGIGYEFAFIADSMAHSRPGIPTSPRPGS